MLSINVIDMLGREVAFFSQNLTSGLNKFDINISHLPASTYIAKIQSDNNEIKTEKKFIKMNK